MPDFRRFLCLPALEIDWFIQRAPDMHINIRNPFKRPTPQDLARRELRDAERQLLLVQSLAAYYFKMSEYYFDTVKRLNKYLNTP